MNKLELKQSFQRQKNHIEQSVAQHLEAYGLADWTFSWDYARQRLGCCRYMDKTITLSRYFVACNEHQPHQILDTILHEIAHALAWTHHGEKAHGPHWKAYCIQLGATPRATTPASSVAGLPHKYYVRLKGTGEIVGKYYRKPKFSRYINKLMLRGKPETKGMLELIEANLLHSS